MIVNSNNLQNYKSISNAKRSLTPFQTNKKPAFSSQLLFNVKIKQPQQNGIISFINARIIKLMPEDSQDQAIIWAIKEQKAHIPFMQTIATNFLRIKNKLEECKTDLLALEIADAAKKPEHKIQSLAEVTTTPSNLHLGYNDKKIELLISRGKDFRLKGAAEVLIYGICKHAENTGFNAVTIPSTNNSFYNHINIPKAPDIGKNYYAINRDFMKEFIKRIEKKYQIPTT